ncbi:Cysteine proteinase inhibitor 5 [Zea mays]|uniref:Cysteine proteinase inhibitor 5 n=1 Tax=Zea mays TaxID=4577 RepID=A0A3L6F0I7_MAIZE|nr:Cysteine proteinase inhibitor 5 [Zea mays]
MVLLAATAAVTGSSVAICRSARAAGVTTLSGQYVKIENVKDPYVQGVGEWAVKEHNRQTGESLQFGEVVSGMEQVVAGTNYKLNLATKDPTSCLIRCQTPAKHASSCPSSLFDLSLSRACVC